MTSQTIEQIFQLFVVVWTFLALISLPTVFHLRAEASLQQREKTHDRQSAYVLPDLISIVTFSTLFLAGNSAKTEMTWMFFFFWNVHYLLKIIFGISNPEYQRTKIRNTKKQSAIVLINALINGFYLGWLWPAYALSWKTHPAFISGSLILGIGLIIQITANVRIAANNGNEAYVLNSGLHKLVFCPGYFGEILQWGGFALMTWSAPAAAAFCWMLSSLFVQATSQKYKYLLRFPELPQSRRALIPFIL